MSDEKTYPNEESQTDLLRKVLTREPVDIPAGRLNRDTLDRARFHRLAVERSKRGEKALPGFVDWLVKKRGLRASTALRSRAIVWSLYEETGGDPAAIFHREIWIEAATYKTVIDAHSAIRKLCDWLLETSKNPADHEWAREQIRLILNAPRTLRMPSTRRMLPRGRASAEGVTPLTNEQVQRMLDKIDELAVAYRVRAPWYRDVMRILVFTGISYSELPTVSRRDLVVALQQQKRRSWIRVVATGSGGRYPKRHRVKVVPLMFVRDEVKRLLAWPFEWRVIADLMAPTGDPVRALKAATERIRRAFQEVADATLPDSEVHRRMRWKALRNWIMVQTFRAQHDWVLLSQISGLSIKYLRIIPWLRAVESERLLGPGASMGEDEADVAEGLGWDDDALDDPVSLGDDELDAVIGESVEVE